MENRSLKPIILGEIVPQYITSYYTTTAASTTPFNTPATPKVMNGVSIHPSRDSFSFGNCATIAICQAFDIPFNAFRAICKLMKIKVDKDGDDRGLDFFECKRLINLLSDSCRCTSKYIPNTGKVSYTQMLLLLNKGKYLTMFDIHLSFAENGEVYDSYFYNLPSDFKESIPTGWWKIN